MMKKESFSHERTTSAYAENTQHVQHLPHDLRNYLRVRGEYRWAHQPRLSRRELPPRTRRIHLSNTGVVKVQGTTSAYAENTPLAPLLVFWWRNYLRVRGEYLITPRRVIVKSELPPRTRRIPRAYYDRGTITGTTSAYAENTHHPNTFTPKTRNYLRVRGEY